MYIRTAVSSLKETIKGQKLLSMSDLVTCSELDEVGPTVEKHI